MERGPTLCHVNQVADVEICEDCGVVLPRREGPTHPYLGASSSCWALYGEILAREYSDPL